jgi:hypothetical protein
MNYCTEYNSEYDYVQQVSDATENMRTSMVKNRIRNDYSGSGSDLVEKFRFRPDQDPQH